MSGDGEAGHAEYDELRHCKYGCNYRTTSKSGLTQHEAHCTLQRSSRAQERAEAIEAERGRRCWGQLPCQLVVRA